MAPVGVLISALLLLGTSVAQEVPAADLQRRDAVNDCKNVLVALKASAFCSSFVPITDSTVLVPSTGPPTTTTTTVTAAPCTTVLPVPPLVTETTSTTTTETLTATTTVTVTTGPLRLRRAAPSTSTAKASSVAASNAGPAVAKASSAAASSAAAAVAKATSAAAKATSAAAKASSPAAASPVAASPAAKASQCTIKGLPVQLNTFTCDIIKQACLLFVKPKTVTSTVSVAGPTVTVTTTTTNPCVTVTPPTPTTTVTNTVTTDTTTTTTVTTTSTISASPTPQPDPKACSGTYDYCAGDSGDCVCYPTVSGGGSCAVNGGACGTPCNSNADCGGYGCLTDCARGGSAGGCSGDANNVCVPASSPTRLFSVRGVSKKDVIYRPYIEPHRV